MDPLFLKHPRSAIITLRCNVCEGSFFFLLKWKLDVQVRDLGIQFITVASLTAGQTCVCPEREDQFLMNSGTRVVSQRHKQTQALSASQKMTLSPLIVVVIPTVDASLYPFYHLGPAHEVSG